MAWAARSGWKLHCVIDYAISNAMAEWLEMTTVSIRLGPNGLWSPVGMEPFEEVSIRGKLARAKWPGKPGRDGNGTGVVLAGSKPSGKMAWEARSGWKPRIDVQLGGDHQGSECPGKPGRDGNRNLIIQGGISTSPSECPGKPVRDGNSSQCV